MHDFILNIVMACRLATAVLFGWYENQKLMAKKDYGAPRAARTAIDANRTTATIRSPHPDLWQHSTAQFWFFRVWNSDSSWFVMPQMCWTMAAVCGTFDSWVGSTPVFRADQCTFIQSSNENRGTTLQTNNTLVQSRVSIHYVGHCPLFKAYRLDNVPDMQW